MVDIGKNRKLQSVVSKEQKLSTTFVCDDDEDRKVSKDSLEKKEVDSSTPCIGNMKSSKLSVLGGNGSAKVRLSWTYYSTVGTSASGGYLEFRPTDDGEWSTWASVFAEFRVDGLSLEWDFSQYVHSTDAKWPTMAIAYLPGRDAAPGNWAAINDMSTCRTIVPSTVKSKFSQKVRRPQMWDNSSSILYDRGKWLNSANNAGVYSGRFYLYGSDGFMVTSTAYVYLVGHMFVSFRIKR